MSFVQIGEEYYNNLAIGKLYTKEEIDPSTGTETTKYFMETIGGQQTELTQQEYNTLIGE